MHEDGEGAQLVLSTVAIELMGRLLEMLKSEQANEELTDPQKPPFIAAVMV